MRGSLMRGRHRGSTELVRKSRNVSRNRVATLNVGDEVVLPQVNEQGRGLKAVLGGSPRTTSGVGVIVSERFRNSIVSVERFDDRLMKIVVAAKERLYHFLSAYAPQSGCSDQAMDEFWNLLDEKTAEVPSKDVIIVAGDLNGHVGAAKDGYSCHGGFGYGSCNPDGERILKYAESHSLTIVNTVFRKRDSHLISYYSGSSKSQRDFVLVKDRDRSLVTDAKVVPYETVAPQHRPLICTLKIASQRLKQVERCGAARIKLWRMKEKEAAVLSRVRSPTDRDRSLVTDAKVVPYETVAPQHRPLICTLKIASPRLKQVERCGAARIKRWRMKEKEAAVLSRVRSPTVTTVDETWKKATDAIRQAARHYEAWTTSRHGCGRRM
ncbi:unnamed protein product [Heligmosomoides polygyrus]|uniref:Endo/exonuclease/phosphatase domain-containing protein n=1 Tax=Heligmosomoides polygyrus TaxID=6339 RepID=A0A183GHV8_HELPZ|nr:unnamed protein product [Heligmosomoides polygyrus]